MEGMSSHSESTFEEIKHINEYGQEYWFARELGLVLGYTDWRNFLSVISKAMQAAETVNPQSIDRFVEVNKLIEAGKGAQRQVQDFQLSRYASFPIQFNHPFLFLKGSFRE
jgi:DNA-damage-inducible protein D